MFATTKRNGPAATNDRPARTTTKSVHSAPAGAAVPSLMALAMRQAIQQACAVGVVAPQIERKRLRLAARVSGRALTEVFGTDGRPVWYVKSLHDHRALRVGGIGDAAALLAELAAGGQPEGR